MARNNNNAYQNRPAGRQLYYSYDGLGSVATLSNHKGKLKTTYQYDAFGQLTVGDITENSYTFTGRRFDEESGMYHFHFRQYDSATGVWTTPDPIGIFGGINFYSYVANNPVNFWDWLGLTLSAGEAGVGNPGSYGGENTPDSMGGTNGAGTGNSHGSENENSSTTSFSSVDLNNVFGPINVRTPISDTPWYSDPEHPLAQSTNIGEILGWSVRALVATTKTTVGFFSEEINTIIDSWALRTAEILAEKEISKTLGRGLIGFNRFATLLMFPDTAQAPTIKENEKCPK